jgi:hypothetical protein
MVLEQRAEQVTGGLFVTFIMAVTVSQERKRPLVGQASGRRGPSLRRICLHWARLLKTAAITSMNAITTAGGGQFALLLAPLLAPMRWTRFRK